MIRYLVKRILFVPVTLLVIMFLCFALVALYPGDFYTGYMIGAALQGLDPFEFHAQILALRGLDKPWIVQFAFWVEGVVAHGDLGYSFQFGEAVSDYVFARDGTIGWSLIILSTSIALALLFGIPVGVLSAARYRKPFDHAMTVTTFVFASTPPQLLALLFLYGYCHLINMHVRSGLMWGICHYSLIGAPLSWEKVASYVFHLLPVWFIVGAPIFATVVRTIRLQLRDVLSQQYIETARGKGISERRMLFHHALPNVLGTLISQAASIQALALVGLFLVGEILNIPSIGELLMEAIRRQDQPLLNGVLLLFSVLVLAGNLIGDILLVTIDPRIRYG